MNSWVALILLGSGWEDIHGAHELCASIFYYEPDVRHVMLICDSRLAASQAHCIITTFGERVSAIVAPSKHPTDSTSQYLCANVLYGLDAIESRFNDSFVVKMDADSLVIAPFSEQVRSFFSVNADCGICGTLGRTSAREHPTYGYERDTISPLVRMFFSLQSDRVSEIASLTDGDIVFIAKVTSTVSKRLSAFNAIVPVVQEAVRNGYRWLEYCQGGGYAISWPLLSAMRKAGYLTQSALLYGIPTGEDVLISMYCRSLGFRVMDYSEPGQPFACMWHGLPHPPKVLMERRHAVVHSLKGNDYLLREQLQVFFKEFRN